MVGVGGGEGDNRGDDGVEECGRELLKEFLVVEGALRVMGCCGSCCREFYVLKWSGEG